MQNYFNELVASIVSNLHSEEFLIANFRGEQSDFVRLNHNKVRQAGNVNQFEMSLDLISGKRHVEASCNIVGDKNVDLFQLTALINNCRAQIKVVSEDPYLYYSTEVKDSTTISDIQLPETQAVLDQIMATAGAMDLVGIWASGNQVQGFANSAGQRNWFSKSNFNFDWSVYYNTDKAVKSSYAGFDWQDSELSTKLRANEQSLEIISRQAITLAPGKYRVYLSPVALDDIISTSAWGGYSLKAHKTAQTPLLKMITEGKTLHDSVTLSENFKAGLSPMFTEEGFVKPDNICLIEKGRYLQCLVNSRSAQEFQQPVNSGSEFPNSLDLAAGNLPQNKILQELDTGIYINNLWYCNFSDRDSCRITGMTRYACFWVENGEIVAPINVMRFDETIYNILGDNLLGLTNQREFIFAADSYRYRSNASSNMPGALVEHFSLTL